MTATRMVMAATNATSHDVNSNVVIINVCSKLSVCDVLKISGNPMVPPFV